jgi:hypothetical protein
MTSPSPSLTSPRNHQNNKISQHIISDDSDQDEKEKLLSPDSNQPYYQAVDSYKHKNKIENNKLKKFYKSFCSCLPCIFFIAGTTFNIIAISFLSMRISNPKKFNFNLKIDACLGIFISMAVIGIILMTAGYALVERQHIKHAKSTGKNNDRPSTCNKNFILFTIGAILNAVGIDFLCMRIANPHEFSLGLKTPAHLGTFISMAVIGLVISEVGYFLAKKSLKSLRESVKREQNDDTTDQSYFDPDKQSPMRTAIISSRISDNIKTENNEATKQNTILGTLS